MKLIKNYANKKKYNNISLSFRSKSFCSMSLSFSVVVRSKLLVEKMFSKREEKLLPSDEYYVNLQKKNKTPKNEEFQTKLQNLKMLAKNEPKTPKSAKINSPEASMVSTMKNAFLQKRTLVILLYVIRRFLKFIWHLNKILQVNIRNNFLSFFDRKR